MLDERGYEVAEEGAAVGGVSGEVAVLYESAGHV